MEDPKTTKQAQEETCNDNNNNGTMIWQEEAVDAIIQAANTINKLFKCQPCYTYMLRQLDYEMKATRGDYETKTVTVKEIRDDFNIS